MTFQRYAGFIGTEYVPPPGINEEIDTIRLTATLAAHPRAVVESAFTEQELAQ